MGQKRRKILQRKHLAKAVAELSPSSPLIDVPIVGEKPAPPKGSWAAYGEFVLLKPPKVVSETPSGIIAPASARDGLTATKAFAVVAVGEKVEKLKAGDLVFLRTSQDERTGKFLVMAEAVLYRQTEHEMVFIHSSAIVGIYTPEGDEAEATPSLVISE